MNEHYIFENPPLNYPYNAIEPFIDAQTMEIHHNRHLQSYVNNLNNALKDYPEYQTWSLEKLIRKSDRLPKEIATTVRNNAGGMFNHIIFFDGLGMAKERIAVQDLALKIDRTYGSLDNFEKEFKRLALRIFGSGYLWLVANAGGNLKIIATANQDTPLTMDLCPIMCIDVWEHAYYLAHLNDRAAYIDNFLDAINWQEAEKKYVHCRRANCMNKRF